MKRELSSHHRPAAFVTYGWCRTAYTVVRSLGARGIEVHVGDASSMAMSRYSRHCRSFHLLPDFFAEPDAYFASVIDSMRKTNASVLFPCHEDVELFSRRRSELPRHVAIAVPDFSMWQTAEDKLLYANHVANAGCPVPKTIAIQSPNALEDALSTVSYPVVVKTRIGNSAKGVKISANAGECRNDVFRLVQLFKLPNDRWPTLQEFVEGQKLGVLGIYDHGKHVDSIVFEIRRSKGAANFGTSTYRITVDDPITKANAIKAMESLHWHGVVDMDWIRAKDGIAKLIDINGRLGGATALTCFSGMDMPYYWYLIALGKMTIQKNELKINSKARWILGDMLGFIDSFRARRFAECSQILIPLLRCKNDDLILQDPVPFFMQFVDYGIKFFASGAKTNPITEGMLR